MQKLWQMLCKHAAGKVGLSTVPLCASAMHVWMHFYTRLICTELPSFWSVFFSKTSFWLTLKFLLNSFSPGKDFSLSLQNFTLDKSCWYLPFPERLWNCMSVQFHLQLFLFLHGRCLLSGFFLQHCWSSFPFDAAPSQHFILGFFYSFQLF